MSALLRLLSAHKPFGIYDIKSGGNIHSELTVYAKELDMLQEELDVVLSECFISTAQAEGLETAERIWGAVRDDLPLEKRRSMILSRYAISADDFTAQTAQKLLTATGISGVLTEYPGQFRITVEIDEEYPIAQRKWIRSQLRTLFPAHLEIDPVFWGFCWADAESLGLCFSDIDNSPLCWDDADIFCID